MNFKAAKRAKELECPECGTRECKRGIDGSLSTGFMFTQMILPGSVAVFNLVLNSRSPGFGIPAVGNINGEHDHIESLCGT